jgi:hypothetical protein
MASRLINQVDPPWVQPLDIAKFPNQKNLIPRCRTWTGIRRASTARRGPPA